MYFPNSVAEYCEYQIGDVLFTTMLTDANSKNKIFVARKTSGIVYVRFVSTIFY